MYHCPNRSVFRNPTSPSNPGGIVWPPITNENKGTYLSIKTRPELLQNYRKVAADFWNNKIPEIIGREGPSFNNAERNSIEVLVFLAVVCRQVVIMI